MVSNNAGKVVEAFFARVPAGIHPWRQRRWIRQNLSDDVIDAVECLPVAQADGILKSLDALYDHPFYSFEPRTDSPGVDEQTGYIESDSYCTVCVGGNGSGKTFLGAQRSTQLFESNPPPAKDTPFWVIGPTYDISCGACWSQKLYQIIPHEWIDWDRITWEDSKKNWPDTVPLKPWGGKSPKDRDARNWSIGFRSYEQGREKMQGWAVGGAWFTEQFPEELFNEVERGLREYNKSGAVQNALTLEFTPIDPAKALFMETQFDQWQNGNLPHWKFCKFHTRAALDAGHVGEQWFDSFFSSVSDDMRAVRMAGEFASYEGIIYKGFDRNTHVRPFGVPAGGVRHRRAIDWGSSEEHAFVCLWGFVDTVGTWYIYDELYSTDQTLLWSDLIRQIKYGYKAPWEGDEEPEKREVWRDDAFHGTTYVPPDQGMGRREFQAGGIPCGAAYTGVYRGIDMVKKAMGEQAWGEPGLVIHPRCRNLIREMRLYRWMKSKREGLNPAAAKPEPLKVDDHACDALRYLIASEGKAIEKAIPAAMRVQKDRRVGLIGGNAKTDRQKWDRS